MTLVKHELRQSRSSLIIWTAAIAFLMIICVLMYPEMKGEMDGVSDMFASMGSFTQAFGMDRISFGTLIGFYAVEGGNILGLGGAFFASLIAISALAKEEKERTAEFLLTHPIGRAQVVTEKLAAVLLQILVMNAVIWLLSVGSIALIGEQIPWTELNLLHLSYLLLQIELAGICFGISAFLRRGSLGIGLGIAGVIREFIAQELKDGTLLELPLPFPIPSREIGFVYQNGQIRPEVEEELIRGARQKAENHCEM